MSYRRNTFIEKAAQYLSLDVSDIIVLNIEKGIFNNTVEFCKQNGYKLKWSDKEFVRNYSYNARRILANINYTPNASSFKKSILENKIDPYSVVMYTKEQMYPEMWAELKLNNLKKHMFKQEEESSDGMFKCNNCKSMKTVYYQMQTRSADEPMTTYVTCTNCDKRWKC